MADVEADTRSGPLYQTQEVQQARSDASAEPAQHRNNHGSGDAERGGDPMDGIQLHAQAGHRLGQGVVAHRGFEGQHDQAAQQTRGEPAVPDAKIGGGGG